MKRALLAVVAGALLLPLASARVGAQGTPPLKFFKNYFITGDYAVGGTSLWRKGVNGVAIADINVAGVPGGVDIAAAFLYVQTAEHIQAQGSGVFHATFQGHDLTTAEGSVAKALNWEQATNPCWSVAIPGGRRLVTYRADVLRFLPTVKTAGSPNFGKFDLSGPLRVTVPDFGFAFGDDDELGVENPAITGPRAVGASLVIVYNSNDPAAPLRGVVIYDGGHTKTAFASMVQGIGGLYQAAAVPNARLTAIVGDGRPYLSERVRVNGAVVATNPFTSSDGPKWDNKTFALPQVTANASGLTFEIIPNGLLSDCVSTSALVMSAAVQDTDGDGLIDVWERAGRDGNPILSDPTGQLLPPLGAMGANELVDDLFMEIDAMHTLAPTSYGGAPAKPSHSHLPVPQAVKHVGDAFKNAPTGEIRVHFDPGASYQDPDGLAAPYLIPSAYRRGGNLIDEQVTVCTPPAGAEPFVCQFSLTPETAYPGTVGWKSGYRFLRDAIIDRAGIPEPVGDAPDLCDVPNSPCQRRFDRNRLQSFRYALFAHAIGLPKSEDPNHPDFHVPRTNTGVGDFPGADLMVTLGAFDDEAGLPIGTAFQQAGTWMHEMGHGLLLRHGGDAFQPNCKPLYFSAMNYLYQLRGLLDNQGIQRLDFAQDYPAGVGVDELSLPALSLQPYRMGWFAPLVGSNLEDNYPPNGTGKLPTRFCNGGDFPVGGIPQVMIRVDSPTLEELVDWAADGNPGNPAATVLDVNFDGLPQTGLTQMRSSNDWSNIRLNQIGIRRNVGAVYNDTITIPGTTLDAIGPFSVDMGKGDLGKGDLGKGDLGKGDLGKGDLGKGDLGKGDLGKGDLGKGDLGKGDLGTGDIGSPGDPNALFGEMDDRVFSSMGKDPVYNVNACVVGETCEDPPDLQDNDVLVSWNQGPANVASYITYRVPGLTIPAKEAWGDPIAIQGPDEIEFVDTANLVNGAPYTYFIVVRYTDDTFSPASNPSTIYAVNDPPEANADAYQMQEDGTLAVEAPGVLGNDADDTDDDLTAVLVIDEEHPDNGPKHGDLELNEDGSFTYEPDLNFHGTDTFRYAARSGEVDSLPVTVTITVNPVNDAPTAAPDNYSMNEDTTLTVGVPETPPGLLFNDGDVDDDSLTVTLVTSPAHGTLVLNPADGSFSYTPAPNNHEDVTFTYKANDGTLDSPNTVVTIVIDPVNDAPVANAQMVSTNEDTAKAIVVTGFDTDGPSTLTFSVVTQPTNGAVTFTAPNVMTYTPNANFNGSDSFTFRAHDGAAYSEPATVGITVNAVNDAPVAVINAYTMVQGTTLTVQAPGVLGNDTDVDSATLTAHLVNTPPNCTLQFNSNGSFTFTPAGSFTGTVSFSYKAKDGALFSNVATVTITVTPGPYSGIYNVENLPPPSGAKFSRTSWVTFRWNFKRNNQVVSSQDAQPSVTIIGPNGLPFLTATPQTCLPATCGEFQDYSLLKKWLFKWKPGASAPTGFYYVYVSSGLTNQTFPAAPAGVPPVNGYKVEVKQ